MPLIWTCIAARHSLRIRSRRRLIFTSDQINTHFSRRAATGTAGPACTLYRRGWGPPTGRGCFRRLFGWLCCLRSCPAWLFGLFLSAFMPIGRGLFCSGFVSSLRLFAFHFHVQNQVAGAGILFQLDLDRLHGAGNRRGGSPCWALSDSPVTIRETDALRRCRLSLDRSRSLWLC